MTVRKHNRTAYDDTTADHVEQYLLNNPDFFESRHGLLGKLVLAHPSGSAVSLIEKQVAVLRKENRQLCNRLSQLLANARENESLQARLYDLYFTLMDASSLEEINNMLAERLRTEFNADRISLILFVDADEKITDTGASVHPNLYWAVRQADGNFPEAYQRYCQNKQPYCGELIPQHSTLLFANHPDDTRSMAVLPLVRDDCFGLFAIGSRDRGRFHADIGTTFLAQLGCFLSRTLWPYRNIFISKG